MFRYQCCVIVFCLIIVILYLMNPVKINSTLLSQTINMKSEVMNTCKHFDDLRINAPRTEFNININQTLKNCFQPAKDNQRLTQLLNFMWRPR
jgi:hypothetical protein